MNFSSRSFVQSNIYRPQPLIHYSEEDKLLVVLTPWGSPENSESTLQTILNYISAVKEDNEATSPFQRIPTISSVSNTLRTAVLLANDQLFRGRNKKEYLEGYELFVGWQKNNEFTWISHGHPHILLSRKTKSILPLSLDLDHSLNLGRSNELSPLPNSLIGIHSIVELSIKSVTPQSGDQILLLNRSWINEELITAKDRSYENYIKLLTKKDESSFWFGCLEF